MSKIEVIAPYLNGDMDRHLKRSLTNLLVIKDRINDLLDISEDNTAFNDVVNIISTWAEVYDHSLQGIIGFSFIEKSSDEIEFYFSTNLPDIINEQYLTINVKHGDIEEYKNLRLFSCTNQSNFSKYTKNLYIDNFVIFPYILYWLTNRIIKRKSIEIEKTITFDGIYIKYYQPTDKNLIEINLDNNKLDLVRDRWYQFLIETGFTVKD